MRCEDTDRGLLLIHWLKAGVGKGGGAVIEDKITTTWLDNLQSFWAIASVYCLGVALAFNVGYFHVPLGNNPYLVTIEDMAKSFLYAVVLYVILQGAIYLFQDINEPKFKRQIYLLTVIAIIGTIGLTAFDLYTSIQKDSGIDFYYYMWTLSVRLLAIVFVLVIYKMGIVSVNHITVGSGIIISFLIIGISYSFGVMMFYGDVRSPKSVLVHMAEAQSYSYFLISGRTQFYLFQEASSCSYFLIDRSNVLKLELLPVTPSKTSALRLCFEVPSWLK